MDCLFLICHRAADKMSTMTGDLLHTDWQWTGHMFVLGVVIGGVLWAFLADVLGWLIAIIYNRRLQGGAAK